jgi:hypothetical protein
MALTERVIVRILVEDDGVIFETRTTVIERDGVVVAESGKHRVPHEPGADTTRLSGRVRRCAEAVWTKDTVDAYMVKKIQRERRVLAGLDARIPARADKSLKGAR